MKKKYLFLVLLLALAVTAALIYFAPWDRTTYGIDAGDYFVYVTRSQYREFERGKFDSVDELVDYYGLEKHDIIVRD